MWKRWEEQKLVQVDNSSDEPTVTITEKGMKRALKYKLNQLKIQSPMLWDKKWRVVIFDVPENKKRNRDYFRSYLSNLGFFRLNESVFIYPHSCFDEIEFLRQISGIGKEVTYMIVENIETSADLKKHFNLD